MVKLVSLDYDEMFWKKYIEPEGKILDNVENVNRLVNEINDLFYSVEVNGVLSYRDIIKFSVLEHYLTSSKSKYFIDTLASLCKFEVFLMGDKYTSVVESYNKDCDKHSLKELWNLEEKTNEED